ncbi:hypothetical protein A2501_04525 [Candidatus Uhrbacteria bacterium RIFOXYC12_FULL_57_11]|nr:MAG: hypothetical protein A2501_04525 [Candidatus Uhrbacteria bacterium RIFOXYC12_FULL_57_11]
MAEYFNVDREAIFEEIVERGRAQGVTTQETYNDLVEEVIESHRAVGEIHDDSPTEDMEEQLRGRWTDYKESLGLDDAQPQL